MIIRRKPPRELKLHEPIRHEAAHKRPYTRRDFLSQSLVTGSATVVGPTLAGLLAANPALALDADIAALKTPCGVVPGADKIPFIAFDLSGGGNLVGSEVLVGAAGKQTNFLTVPAYGLQGLPPSMVPNTGAPGSFIDASLGLLWHADGAILRGIKTRASTTTQAGVNGAAIPAVSQNDTSMNPHNPMYGIAMAGANGQLLRLIGTSATPSGGNSASPADEIIAAWTPSVIAKGSDSAGLVNTGLLTQLLAPTDAVSVLESMYRISAMKMGTVSTQLANDASIKQAASCNYVKAAALAEEFPNASVLNPDLDPVIVDQGSARASGIFGQAEYQASGDLQKTAAVMKLVVNGFAGAGTIQLDGFDYHGQGRATGEVRNFNAGVCIGACLEYAARVGRPLMVYVFTDGGINANSMVDSTPNGRGKFMWQGDNGQVTAPFFLIYSPRGRVPAIMNQIGSMTPDGSVDTASSPAANSVNLLVQTVILNYLALHGQAGNFAAALTSNGATPGIFSAQYSSLIAFPPMVNGTV